MNPISQPPYVQITNPTPDFHERVRKGQRILSYSQISCFLQCRHRWYLQYYLGLHTLAPSQPLILGDCVHQAMAAYLSHSVPLEQSIRDYFQEQIGSPHTTSPYQDAILTSADQMATAALFASRQGIDALRSHNFEPLILGKDVPPTPTPHLLFPQPRLSQQIKAVELALVTDISSFAPSFEHFESHIDLIAYSSRDRRVWIVDYKTRKQFQQRVAEDVNLQAMIYACMASFHGINITGTATLEIRSIPPELPKLNQDGTMSRQRIATTWEVYRQELIRRFLNPDDYEQDMKPKLNTPFTRLTTEFRPPHTLERVWSRLIIPLASLMSHIISQLDQYHVYHPDLNRNLNSFNCTGCGVREVCLAGLYDRDIEHIINQRDGNLPLIAQALQAGAF